jgi:membrane-associated phospholipid phosphatase
MAAGEPVRGGRHQEVPPGPPGRAPAAAGSLGHTRDRPPASRARAWRALCRFSVPAALAGLFTALAVMVAPGSGPVWALDRAVSRDAGRLAAAHPAVTAAASAITELGDWRVGFPVLAACAGLAAWRARSPGPALRAALAAGILVVLVILVKWLTARPGPGGAQGDGLGFFPSGHTALAIICYGMGIWLLAAGAARVLRAAARALAVAVVVAVSVSLVWCRYHWLSDVVASGALSGLELWALFLTPLAAGRPDGGPRSLHAPPKARTLRINMHPQDQ